MTSEELVENEREKERQEALEHRDVLLAIGAILKNNEGIQLFSYLFKSLNVATVPTAIEGNLLHEELGFLKAGNSIYKLVCEADFEIAASILSKLERQRYDDLHREHEDTSET